MSVQITVSGSKLLVDSPYHPDFPSAAKKLGGKWNSASKAWSFDARDEARVRELCIATYGTDGSPATGALVTVRIKSLNGEQWDKGGIYFCGRCLCYATGRDSGARLGEGVVSLAGKYGSGGSVKNWVTRIESGAVFEVRDLPRAALEQVTDNWEVVEVPEQPSEPSQYEALVKEKSALLQRLAQIDVELERCPKPCNLRDISLPQEVAPV